MHLRFVGQDNIILCIKVSFSMFELFKPDLEATLFSVQELILGHFDNLTTFNGNIMSPY